MSNGNGKQLLVRDDSKLTIALAPDAIALREESLACAGLIGRVASAEDQQEAVNAQKALVGFRNAVESSRKLAKQPVLDYGRSIDEAARQAVAEVAAEELRITKLVADFQALEMAKVRAREAAENERLLAIERERQAALAEAVNHDDLDRVNGEFDARVADEAPAPMTPARVEGQIVREEICFEVLDVWALAAAHPQCVKPPEPKRLEIKALLDSGIKVTGVRAWKEVKAGVRVGRGELKVVA